MPNLQSIKQIRTEAADVYAFDISGHVSADDAEAMAQYMNDVFDKSDKVSMLMRLNDYTGSDATAMFDDDVIASRWRSLAKVDRYVVVGAPAFAEKMIAVMDKIIPVDAKTFDADDEVSAWAYVGTTPSPST